MNTLQVFISLLVVCLTGSLTASAVEAAHASPEGNVFVFYPQVSAPGYVLTAEQEAVDAINTEEQGLLSVRTLWLLTERAGPFRWPIFGVFLIGVFLVFLKFYELMSDRKESREIEGLSYPSMDVSQIIHAISGQRESMLARLQATMLNVYQAEKGDAELQVEITSFIKLQQDRFDSFKRRIDFLADTAGAIGLLGTVWGIFSVFSGGILDDQVILSGMGIALITTLLGLVVSILLNFSSTEIFGLFNSRLDRISEKSDELRIRLMELATESKKTETDPYVPGLSINAQLAGKVSDAVPMSLVASKTPHARASTAVETRPAEISHQERTEGKAEPQAVPNSNNKAFAQRESKPFAQVEAMFEDRMTNSPYGDSLANNHRKPLVESSVEYPNEPHSLRFINSINDTTVGKKLRNVGLRLTDGNGNPVAGRSVLVHIEEGGSLFNESKRKITLDTDERGEVHFDLQIAKKAGKQNLAAHVPGSDEPGTACSHEFYARPGVPRKLKQFGNNQGGIAGELLAKALKVQVLDEFENPIPDWSVIFSIELGGGTLENGLTELKVTTNKNGEGIAHLKVGMEPGFNTVKAAVEGVVRELKFQAMSMA